MQGSEHIYKEVMTHYRSCQGRAELLSDTWAHTLVQKGEMYSIQEMMHMRFPGNRVNSWMVDSLFLVDGTIIDLHHPVIARLLELGESDFGNPRKDTKIGPKSFSSLFLIDVVRAARIIQMLEDAGLTHPRVMEIGGGSGLLLSLLKGYFKDRITLFFVDIPETLLIQEWYLRNCFPQADHAYKSSKEHVNFKTGGFNFINGYILETQDIEFDMVCNFASMLEMTEGTVQGYLKYIEKNISANGVFYFSNGFGRSSGCVTEPSEYPLDPHWKIESAAIGCPIEMCKNEYFLDCIFRRTKGPVNTEARRMILRTVWNGFPAGLIQDENIIKELLALGDSHQDPLEGITQILRKNDLQASEIPLLKTSAYLAYDSYLHNVAEDRGQLNGKYQGRYYLENINRRAEVDIIRLMLDASVGQKGMSIQSVKRQVNDLCAKALNFETSPLNSEYWTARFAGMLLSLGAVDKGVHLIRSCVENTEQARWLVRFAILLSRYGCLKEANWILERLEDKLLDPFLLLKRVELKKSCGHSQEALVKELADVFSFYGSDPVIRIEIAKTAAKIGALEILQEACFNLKEKNMLAQRVGNPFFRISSLAIASLPSGQACEFIQKCYQLTSAQDTSSGLQMEYGVLNLQMGNSQEGFVILENIKKIFHDSYFNLGWAGSLLKKIGYHDLADTFLTRSLELRPNNFMHNLFMGGVYFSAGQYAQAGQLFEKAAVSKPYLLSLRARAAFCRLPDEIRDSGVFGNASDLNIIFEQDQNFYGDSPNWK